MAEMNPLRCRMIEDMKVRNLSPANAAIKSTGYRLALRGRLSTSSSAPCVFSTALPSGGPRWSIASLMHASGGNCL